MLPSVEAVRSATSRRLACSPNPSTFHEQDKFVHLVLQAVDADARQHSWPRSAVCPCHMWLSQPARQLLNRAVESPVYVGMHVVLLLWVLVADDLRLAFLGPQWDDAFQVSGADFAVLRLPRHTFGVAAGCLYHWLCIILLRCPASQHSGQTVYPFFHVVVVPVHCAVDAG